MKLKFKILIAFVLLISISAFIFNFDNYLASSVTGAVAYILTSLVFLIIPILIILYILKSKGKITNDIIKMILKVIGLLFLGSFVLGLTAGAFDDEDTSSAIREEYFGTEELENQNKEKNIQQSLPTKISQIIPSKMGNGWYSSDEQEAYYDHAEILLENYVLSYKGQDNSGLDLLDLTIILLTEQCGLEVILEKYHTEINIVVSDELDNPNNIIVNMLTTSDIRCAVTYAYQFDVNLRTGKITSADSWGDAGAAGLLGTLDEFD